MELGNDSKLRHHFCNSSVNTHTKALFRYKVGFIRQGKRHWITPWKNNLILDCGLDKVASVGWCRAFEFCLFGNQVAPSPVARNSGAVTLSQTTTTITASGSFFVAQDTGRLFKFDSGEECYLTFMDATHATASISRSVGSGPGTIWYVNQTALESLFDATSTYGATGGDNGWSAVGNVTTNKRTYTGSSVAAPVTLTEIGFSHSGANATIFDRDIITGGVALIIGDIPLAVAELITTYTQNTVSAVGNVGTGFDSSGDFQLTALAKGSSQTNVQWVNNGGGTDGLFVNNPALEPNTVPQLAVYTATFSIPAFTSGTVVSFGSGITANMETLQSYSAGNFYRDTISFFDISTPIGNIYGIGSHKDENAWAQKLTTFFNKTGAQTLTITTRKSWQRILTN